MWFWHWMDTGKGNWHEKPSEGVSVAEGGMMSHSVNVTLIADQEIQILGDEVNIYDLVVIYLDGRGNITAYAKRKNEDDPEGAI